MRAAELVGGAHRLVDVAVLGAGRADEEGAGDVGHVPAPSRAEIDKQRLAPLQAALGARGAVRVGGGAPGEHDRLECQPVRAGGEHLGHETPAEVGLAHAGGGLGERGGQGALADRDRPAHGVDLAGVLLKAHARDGGMRVEDRGVGEGAAQRLGLEDAHPLALDPDPGRRDGPASAAKAPSKPSESCQ